MFHVPHELAEEFPEKSEEIRTRRMSDRHFARLVDEYHEVNRAVHRLETRVEPALEDREEELRRQRVRLKDQIVQALAAAA